MKHVKSFNEDKEDKTTLQNSMEDFYSEYEDSYIDGNAHGLIKLLIKHLQKDGLLEKGKWNIK